MSLDLTGENAGIEQAQARWRAGVASVLAKSSRREPVDIELETSGEPERMLQTHLEPDAAGVPGPQIRALYTALDARPEAPLPGRWPYLRGADALRDVNAGWKVTEVFPAAGAASAAETNAAVLDALAEGASAMLVRVGENGVPAADLRRVFDGVYVNLAPVRLEGAAAGDYTVAAEVLWEVVEALDPDTSGGLSVDLGADPLTAPCAQRPAPSLDEVLAVATRAAGYRGVRAIAVDGPVVHNMGATAAGELAAVLAAAVAYLRLLTDAGLTVAQAAAQISFRLAADDDQFTTIAKIRAARRLWARVTEVVGAPEAGAAVVHAETSAAMMTQRDPWVNMLRTTLAAFGAGVGGADTVLVWPFDSAIAGGYPGTAPAFSRRIARNTQLLLLEESHLGRVLDPAGGSWYVEDLTEEMAQHAWREFQALERLSAAGGFEAARDHIADSVAGVAARRFADIAHRRRAVTGVNEYPNLAEPPLPASALAADAATTTRRYAAQFEALRDRSDAYLARAGARPAVMVLPLGPIAEHNIRLTFATNLLASGGVQAVNPGTVSPDCVAAAMSAIGQDPPPVAVLCGSDARYASEAAGVIAAARAAGIGRIYLAGPPAAVADAEPKPDDYLTMKIDAVQTLSDVLTRLGA